MTATNLVPLFLELFESVRATLSYWHLPGVDIKGYTLPQSRLQGSLVAHQHLFSSIVTKGVDFT